MKIHVFKIICIVEHDICLKWAFEKKKRKKSYLVLYLKHYFRIFKNTNFLKTQD